MQHPDGDTVTLPDVLDFRRTITVQQTIALALRGSGATLPEITGVLMESYVLHCIDAWTLADDNGPIPVSKDAIRAHLLTRFDVAEKVGDAADELYTDTVALPLVLRGLASSAATRTPSEETSAPPTTSLTTGRGATPRKPSKRSSTSTTPMVVTGTTGWSPGGASSSSLT
jgi:hypothetical protein